MNKAGKIVVGFCVLASVATAASATSVAQAAPKVGQCKRSDLTIKAQAITPASGTWIVDLHFKNKLRAHSCTTFGYPGVAVLSPPGKQKYQAVRTPSGYAGGLSHGTKAPHITLAPGQEATAVLEMGSRHEPGGATCPRYSAARITAPNTFRSARRAVEMYTCKSPQVHPLIAGRTGVQR